MRFKRHFFNTLRAILLFVFVGVLAGCISVFNPYEGKTVNENNRIALMQGGPHEGNWETKQVEFKYNYTRHSNTLNISGDLFLYAASYRTFELVDSLFFRINFIDSDAKLIESRVLWSIASDNFNYQWHIKERTLSLPPNTAAMGFSYSGNVREAGGIKPEGDGGGAALDLWYSPLGE